MHLTLSPVLGGSAETIASVSGDVLTVDGVTYDLSTIPEGGEATPQGEHPFAPGSTITREGGVIHATLLWWLDATAARVQIDAPWIILGASGQITAPAARIEQEPAE